MNWDIGAAVAEIAGAIGVIITLAYLASQITQTNRIAKAAVIRELEQTYIDLYKLIVTDTEVATLVTKLRDPDYRADSVLEEEKLDNFAILLASIWLSTQVGYDHGQIDRQTFQIYLDDVEAKLSRWPGIRPYMKKVVERYSSLTDMEIYKPVYRQTGL